MESEQEHLKEELKRKCDEEVAAYKQSALDEMTIAQEELAEGFRGASISKLRAAQELADKLAELRSSVAAAVEIAKHNMEEKDVQAFYSLQLTDAQKKDIKALRSIEDLLSNAEAINKVIWSLYYENAYTDLIGRLNIGTGSSVCGIYKITNTENQMVYIGQSVNIANRWKQHIKRGIGADTPTQNKLYPAMKAIGPENFTFEVVEQCPRSKLDEREDYWQEFYKAKEFGYSIK